jgi:hypothetical protein
VRTGRKEKRERLVWQGIIDYANADFTSSKSATKQLTKLIENGLTELEMRDIAEVKSLARERQIPMEESARLLAVKYQPDFKKVLLWLTTPGQQSVLGAGAIQFLQRHSSNIKWVLEATDEEFDATGENGTPAFYNKRVLSCDSIMAPICAFLFDRIDQFQDGGRDLLEAIPIRICDRPNCGRFKLPERQRDVCYCSGKCRSAHFQSQKDPTEKAEKMREYRKHPKRESQSSKRSVK